jgi:hypothetical protein
VSEDPQSGLLFISKTMGAWRWIGRRLVVIQVVGDELGSLLLN